MNQPTPIYDVVIVGAGLSGIGAAYHIQKKCPGRSFTILEGRSTMGGTWDLFKYPGIRSDSDMYTLGFSFNPWKDPKAIADGPSILQYIKDTAKKFGIDKKIQYNHKVTDASWSSDLDMWTLTIAEHEGAEHRKIHCNFLFMCSGYYNYEQGYSPRFPNSEAFGGVIVHPQKWDTSLDYAGKDIVVVGSGATAITLVPEMAKKARKVTMLQRSPTYIMNLPSEDAVANFLRKSLPSNAAYQLSRWKNILLSMFLYKMSRKRPEGVKHFIKSHIKKTLGDKYDDRHFTPKYNPWDQRLCLVPDNDLFDAIKQGGAEVVTDTIERFTSKGILLQSGRELEADIIVTATGLNLQLLGGMTLHIDGKPADIGQAHAYRGVMMSDTPNFAVAVGYTNASWTLKCDLNCHFVTKVLNHMEKHGYASCTPRFDESKFGTEPLLDFDANYIKRAVDILPKQGSKKPWKVHQNYVRDLFSLKYTSADDEYLVYD